MRHTRSALSFALTIVTACSSATAPNTATASALAGRWDLARACGGLAGTCAASLPLSEPRSYYFVPDGSLQAVVGDRTLPGRWTFLPAAPSEPAGDALEITLAGFSRRVFRPIRLESDALRLTEPYPDGYTFEYRRAP